MSIPSISVKTQDVSTQNKSDVKVSRGSENYLANTFRNIVTSPLKLVYWNSNLYSGNVSDKTIKKLTDYMEKRGLKDVHVSVNEYDPFGNASRIFSNPKTSTLTKYTMGAISALRHALGFMKLFGLGSDSYDFLSNSIYLTSEDSDYALLAGAQAKEYRDLESPALHAISKVIPFIGPFIDMNCSEDNLEEASRYVKKTTPRTEHAQSYSVMASGSRIMPALLLLVSFPINWVTGFVIGSVVDLENPENIALANLVTPLIAVIGSHLSARV